MDEFDKNWLVEAHKSLVSAHINANTAFEILFRTGSKDLLADVMTASEALKSAIEKIQGEI